ncbi:zinc finger BED domain-containing protein RICESLEEPER 2-like protein [Tanacetum coccineum]
MAPGTLPHCNKEGLVAVEPYAVLDRRLAKKGNAAAVYVLVQWTNGTIDNATWELYDDIALRFPEFDLNMTLESNSVNQTPVEVDLSDMEEEELEVEGEEVEEEDEEKNKLRETIRKNIGRVCLTTDGWTSGTKKKSYMALTGHFIDNDWNLVKKVLNFCRLDGHRGIDIGKGVENCLEEWGFTNILSISVDNASANDSAITFMKLILEKYDDCLLSGEWIHIRCAAHVVNLIVQDGIKHVGRSIESIRCAVKWIKKSGTRIEKFNKCARSARCESTKSLILDCPTRWNSTYNMLEVAHEYKDAFTRYDLEEVDFGLHIRNKGHSVPGPEDWVKAKRLCHFLKTFYDITLRISGTKYVTSHTLVNELATIHDLLRKQLDCDIHGEAPTDKHLYDIARAMKPKFEKYYGEVENMNLLVYFAFILDPRNKYEFLDVIVDDHYGREGISVVEKKKDYIKDKMKLLYEDYVRIHAPSSTSSSTLGKRPRSTILATNSIMEIYLLAIPISTVASESVFSTSGRVLDSFRSSLGDKTIECLVCAHDWLRISLNPEKNEDMDTIAKIEKELMEQERVTTYMKFPNVMLLQIVDMAAAMNLPTRTDSIMDVPTGKAMLGHVFDALGVPIWKRGSKRSRAKTCLSESPWDY